jgi:hypothetical protein
MARRSPGVYVMEGKWEKWRPARKSATQLLALLEQEGRIRVKWHDTRRRRLLRQAFEEWPDKWSFPIGYLAAHGDRGAVSANRIQRASLATIADWIGDGRASGRVLVLGSCLALGAKRQALDLATKAGLLGVLGYRRSAPTIYAAVFEALLIDELASAYERGEPSAKRLAKHVERLKSDQRQLADKLGFDAVWRSPASSDR